MTYKYLIIDTSEQSALSLRAHISALNDFVCIGNISDKEEAINTILEINPEIVFLEINENNTSALGFNIINELYKYLIVLPKFIVLSDSKALAYEAMKYDVYDFILKPFQKMDIIKSLMKYRKEKSFVALNYPTNGQTATVSNVNGQEEKVVLPIIQEFAHVEVKEEEEIEPQKIINHLEVVEPKQAIDIKIDTKELQLELLDLVKKSLETNKTSPTMEAQTAVVEEKKNILCIKSYGDYRFIEFTDIIYLKADNNSTDIILSNGDSVTAFKTLKHFESSLPEEFVRIHNSHIVNVNFVSRIHLGNSDCYLNRGKIKLPFSKSYKENINMIIEKHATLESKDE